jgi:hypothetical protein
MGNSEQFQDVVCGGKLLIFTETVLTYSQPAMHLPINYLKPIMAKGWLAMTIPDKPQSRLQRYQTTEEGKKWLLGATNRNPTS